MPSLRPPSSFSIAPDVRGFRSIMVNYYFVRLGMHDWVLVDAGLPISARRLMREAARRFGAGRPPSAIILTHGHFDHVGSLKRLQREWPDVPVYAHPDEVPFLTDGDAYAPADPTVGGGLMSLTSKLYPRTVGPFRNVLPLPADGSVPGMPEWQWLATGGHSPGHISLWREADRLLLAGDAVTTTRQESLFAVLRQTREVRPPPAYFTPDWEGAYDSLLRIRALQPVIVGSGHGFPAGGHFLQQGLERLVHDFAEIGLPAHGRYVPERWIPRLPMMAGSLPRLV
jgi:glyoxylase-like metal-dependent hydrolase (beta-lactamase superfamily II)